MTAFPPPEQVILDNAFGVISEQRILCYGKPVGAPQHASRNSLCLTLDQVISVRLEERLNGWRGVLAVVVLGGGVSSAVAVGSGALPLGALVVLLSDLSYRSLRDRLVLEPELVITTPDPQPIRVRGQANQRQAALQFVEILQNHLKTIRSTRAPRELNQLLQIAQAQGGYLTLPEAILTTGLSPQAVEDQLKDLVHKGHALIESDPQTGTPRYRFPDLQPQPLQVPSGPLRSRS